MAKYNYNKSVLKGLKVKDFLNQVKVRQSHIDSGSTNMPESIFGPNKLAKELHPEYLYGRIIKKIALPLGCVYIIVPAKDKGVNEFPPFKPGQHITVVLDMPDKFTRRNYCISSSSSASQGERGMYQIVVSDHGPGHASEYINNTWQEGDVIAFSAPSGEVYFEPIRDLHDVLVIGFGGPAMSLCTEIADGNFDINLTALALIPIVEGLLISGAYKEMSEKSGGKIQFVPVLLEGEAPGVEKGPVTADLLKRVMTDEKTGKMKDMTIFVTCPEPICSILVGELKKLGIPDRRIHKEIQGFEAPVFAMPSYPAERIAKQYSLKVWIRGECIVLPCSSDKTIVEAIEDAKIKIKTSCRNGHCGICHSRLISGEYYMPESLDGRREADRKFGWIHPCRTYPLSDMEIEIFPEI